MRFRVIAIMIMFAIGILLGRYIWPVQQPVALGAVAGDAVGGHEHAPAAAPYVCPMHAHIISEKPGTCPICGMALMQAKPGSDESGRETDEVATDSRPVVRIRPEVAYNLGVKTAPVTRTTLVRRIETPGFVQQIQPGQNKRLTAPFDARVVAVLYKPGRWLGEGKPLLVLESETLRSAGQAHLALLQQSAAQPVAQAVTPEAEAAEDESDPLAESRRQLEQLGFSPEDIQLLEQKREASPRLTLKVPYPAIASNPQVAAGDKVRAGAVLLELSGMARASVLANAFQRDAAWIQTGQMVDIRLPHVSGQVWSGVVNQAAVSIDPDSQNIGVRLSFSAPMQLLKSSMYVVATIYGDSHPGVLAVPLEALIRTETEDRVVVAQGDGRFKPVPVRVGIETAGQAEILSGLKKGDQVVVSAQFLLDSESSLQASFLRMSGPAAE